MTTIAEPTAEITKDPTRETVLILRTCAADRSTYNDFVWPESGYVEAPDWDDVQRCGNGLHGWLKGQGDASLGYMEREGFLGQVVETYADHVIDLDGKVKFPFGWVVFTGDMKLAAKILSDKYPEAQVIMARRPLGIVARRPLGIVARRSLGMLARRPLGMKDASRFVDGMASVTNLNSPMLARMALSQTHLTNSTTTAPLSKSQRISPGVVIGAPLVSHGGSAP